MDVVMMSDGTPQTHSIASLLIVSGSFLKDVGKCILCYTRLTRFFLGVLNDENLELALTEKLNSLTQS